jgi:cellulose synthase/poly-beta-1,6-N-acetylglucosamine synthase-like glycosyltransferase
LKKYPVSKALPAVKFSIVVPARNEQENIVNTIQDLVGQDYQVDLFEVLIINDDSTDNTYQIGFDLIEQIKSSHPDIRIFNYCGENSSSGHKKRAIEYGISISKNEWIITTDADCRRGKHWLKSIAACITENSVLISAPVVFHHESTFFEKIQSLEFLSLVGIGAASIGNNSPNLCNGANLAYKKTVFFEVNGFSGNMDISSGDDEFLLHKIAEKYPGQIVFQNNKDAIVYTNALKTIPDFIRQRKRWVSKSTKYKKREVFLILLFVYAFHLLIFVSGLISCFSAVFLMPFILLFGSKMIAESLLVIPLTRYFGKTKYLPLYPFAAIFYIFYVIAIGLIGNSGSYEWKGRKVS